MRARCRAGCAARRPRWTITYSLHDDGVPATSLSWTQAGTSTTVFVTGNSFAPRSGTSPWRAVGTAVLRGDGWIECWMPNYQTNQNREVQLYAPVVTADNVDQFIDTAFES